MWHPVTRSTAGELSPFDGPPLQY